MGTNQTLQNFAKKFTQQLENCRAADQSTTATAKKCHLPAALCTYSRQSKFMRLGIERAEKSRSISQLIDRWEKSKRVGRQVKESKGKMHSKKWWLWAHRCERSFREKCTSFFLSLSRFQHQQMNMNHNFLKPISFSLLYHRLLT